VMEILDLCHDVLFKFVVVSNNALHSEIDRELRGMIRIDGCQKSPCMRGDSVVGSIFLMKEFAK
jgi:hypothetical protein